MSSHPTTAVSRNTLRTLHAAYLRKEKLAMLTAYDYVTAGLLDNSGVDILLVGDSLGNVVLGYDTTLPVTLEDMIRHTSAVVRGTKKALIVADLPFGTTTDPEVALRASIRLMQESGCQAVKLEGGLNAAPIVRRLVDQGIPVMAHIGLTPQSVHQLGGYYIHGKTDQSVRYLVDSAVALSEAGAFSIVLEMVVPAVAAEITQSLGIPTIGIGSGTDCSGQVLVVNDLVGLSLRPPPKFAVPRADVAGAIRGAVREYILDVKGPSLPQNLPQSASADPQT
jgi:3-methyl-2-oxobutanoate hydroxymethyltransferase